MDLVIASLNSHKVREIKALLKDFSEYEIYSLSDFPDYVPPEENAKTLEENALIKATHAAHTLKKWALADDSGLIVPALQGRPGVLSARYAGEGATELENRRKLLYEMKDLTGLRRCAYFECCLAFVSPLGVKKCVKGICEGKIIEKERGGNGFGYDSLFLKNDYNLTFAELDEAIKNKISHRAKALQKLLILLESLRNQEE